MGFCEADVTTATATVMNFLELEKWALVTIVDLIFEFSAHDSSLCELVELSWLDYDFK